MKKQPLAVMTFSAVLLGLTACSDKEPVKSVDYYKQHYEEAKTVYSQCEQKIAKEMSTMPLSEQAAWQETAEGINCKNTAQAISEKTRRDYRPELPTEAK